MIIFLIGLYILLNIENGNITVENHQKLIIKIRYYLRKFYTFQLYATNHLISIKKIQVFWFVIHGLYDLLLLEVETNKKLCQYGSRRSSGLTKVEAANKIASDFVRDYKMKYYKQQIIQSFQQLRLRDVKGITYERIEISVLPVIPHFSCNTGNVDQTDRKDNVASQCDLTQKLSAVVSRTVKFWSFSKTTNALFATVTTKR